MGHAKHLEAAPATRDGGEPWWPPLWPGRLLLVVEGQEHPHPWTSQKPGVWLLALSPYQLGVLPPGTHPPVLFLHLETRMVTVRPHWEG